LVGPPEWEEDGEVGEQFNYLHGKCKAPIWVDPYALLASHVHHGKQP